MDEIVRLRAWVRDFGHEKPPTFVADLEAVLGVAEDAIAMAQQMSSLQKPLEDVLLSDEFLQRFAKAFAETPLPSTIVALPTSSHVR